MKKVILVLVICIAVMQESRGQKQSDNDGLITVDVRKNYSTKKELILQDFMDVEYIPLETNDDFLHQGLVMDIGMKNIVVINRNNDGDIFIYDRRGKALRKINHKGAQTSREYQSVLGITLDEDNNEMFVNDFFSRKIFVYDLNGKFKRSFKHGENADNQCYTSIFNYDKNNLICFNDFNEKSRSFVLISKKDGSITKEIKIPYKEIIPLIVSSKPVITEKVTNGSTITAKATVSAFGPPRYRTIIPFKGSWMLLELSSDTVYTFLPDYNIRPFLVRTPSIQAMNLKVYVLLSLLSDRYYFMEYMKHEYDLKTQTGFPCTPFMYDRQEKDFFRYTLYNGDYSTKKEINISVFRQGNHEIESWRSLESFELIEDYKKGILTGKLKEIASKLDAEDNPVIMLVKHKKQ